MITEVEVRGAFEAGAEITGIGTLLPFRAMAVQRSSASLFATRVGGNVPYAGTPPFVYRDSWEIDARYEDANPVVEAYSTTPYARRLEYGWQKVDRIGRAYDQAGDPSVRPALEGMEELYEESMAAGTLPIV